MTQSVIPTDEQLKSFLTNWMDGPALSQKSLTRLAERHCPNWSPSDMWSHLEQEKWLKTEPNNSFSPSVNAVQWLFKKPARHTIAEGWSVLSQCLDRIHAWNQHARPQCLPQVAAVAVWGSLIRPGQETCGDVDLALIWRRPKKTDELSAGPPATLPAQSALLAHLSSVPPGSLDHFSAGDWEEWSEEWLSSVPLVSLSGVDQWDELSLLRDDFAAQCVWCDTSFSKDPKANGTRPWEAEAFMRHAPPFRRVDQPFIR